VKTGATTASTNRSAAASAVANDSSTGRLTAITPPNADTGSDASAAGKAAAAVGPIASPQGDRCLTTTTAGRRNDSAARQAASRSRRLVYDNSLPRRSRPPNGPASGALA